MNSSMKKYPFHPFLFSIYPALALFSVNFQQVSFNGFHKTNVNILGALRRDLSGHQLTCEES